MIDSYNHIADKAILAVSPLVYKASENTKSNGMAVWH